MSSVPTPPTAPEGPESEALIEQARHEAQEKIAALHAEEGTVNSEGAQNSPSPEDVIPEQTPEEAP